MTDNFVKLMRKERDLLERRLEAVDGFLSAYEEGEELKESAAKKERKKQKKRGAGSSPMSGRTCKNCGKKGHRRDHCPDLEAAGEKKEEQAAEEEGEDDKSGLRCLSCGEENDHATKDCPTLREKIAEMRGEGKDSLRIANALRISLKVVNENWS